MKLRLNTIRDQSNTTNTCGYFAVKFLIDHFNGKSFDAAADYNDSRVAKWRKEDCTHQLVDEGFMFANDDESQQHGEGIKEWIDNGVKFIRKAAHRVKDVLQGVRTHTSPAVRKWLEEYGNQEIVELKICRKPIIQRSTHTMGGQPTIADKDTCCSC